MVGGAREGADGGRSSMSSGAQVARELGTGARVALIAPDSASRYLSTILFADGAG